MKLNHTIDCSSPVYLFGDCLVEMKKIPDNVIDLVVTSPPYANQRKKNYESILPDNYVKWFLPISQEVLRILKPTGTFILNIKEHVVSGERHTYVLELILAIKKQGWLWTEEFIWHKKNCYPGKWPNRFRDAWERLLQFNKTKNFKMFQEAVMVPVNPKTTYRLQRLKDDDILRKESRTGSNFGKKWSNFVGRKMVYPTNVLNLATECHNQGHSAVFPKSLPEWFIKLFTEEHDWILDPFMGSGTTLKVAQKINRNCIGIENDKKIIHNYV